jgi:hypothetical protein
VKEKSSFVRSKVLLCAVTLALVQTCAFRADQQLCRDSARY